VKIQGLASAHQYYYKVLSDGTESPVYTFWTAFPENDSIRFVVYGDSQGEWDGWQTVRIVAQAIEQEQPLFVLKTGDCVDEGWNRTHWAAYFTASSFLHNSTLYPVLGNHENYSGLFFAFFSLPFNERWYSFKNGPVRFIGLNSNRPDRYRFYQYFWLCHELQTHEELFTVVFFHHPLYSSSNHGNLTFLQKIWGPVFERYHVDVVFHGHDHNYERCYVNNVTYIVTGGGGSPLYDNGHSPWTVYSEKTYHYCLLTVNSSTLDFTAKKPDGSVFDSFQLSR
jgi:3',5'-cyclic AMP phosphodiesterase CpdA